MRNWRPADTNMYGCTLSIRFWLIYMSVCLSLSLTGCCLQRITVSNTRTMLQNHFNQFFSLFISITNNFRVFFLLFNADTRKCTHTVMFMLANICKYFLFMSMCVCAACMLFCRVVWRQKLLLNRMVSHRCTKWKANNYHNAIDGGFFRNRGIKELWSIVSEDEGGNGKNRHTPHAGKRAIFVWPQWIKTSIKHTSEQLIWYSVSALVAATSLRSCLHMWFLLNISDHPIKNNLNRKTYLTSMRNKPKIQNGKQSNKIPFENWIFRYVYEWIFLVDDQSFVACSLVRAIRLCANLFDFFLVSIEISETRIIGFFPVHARVSE